ncbi:zinc metalloprotease HtpX [Methanobacterium alcaliphilum]|uniref:zinc metalloprotease HtpX n=1 Tax=Methanobacterium alcaliphilum TaxID=392018 RepID=UPI00200B1294|nr:zinc metalloprotease HtpX [Methanobacterium alcaliphilum]MCK9151729.1 zinc metalloprotease HtpX [Methanobacterium alcaliphilum]
MKKVSTWKLKLRMTLAMMLFGILLAVLVTVVGVAVGITTPAFYAGFFLLILLCQYLAGPKLVEMSMKVHYVSPEEAPNLHRMIDELSMNAGIPKPKVGISEFPIPNAFAFGRRQKDGRVCVTRGLINKLNEGELKAVLGHEISHIKHRDMIVMTLISAVPVICYWLAWSTIFSSGDNDSYSAIVGIAAFVAYIIGQLIVLFVSRVREYYADSGSVAIGGEPHHLASALYKLTYESASADKEQLKEVQGFKAFFVNDISDARNEIQDLSQLDLDMDGTLSPAELERLKYDRINLKTSSKVFELLSTHPNMVKRVKRLAEMS